MEVCLEEFMASVCLFCLYFYSHSSLKCSYFEDRKWRPCEKGVIRCNTLSKTSALSVYTVEVSLRLALG